MEKYKVILQGGGEHARVVLDCLLSSGYHVAALFDPKYSGNLMGVPQLGTYNPSYEVEARAIIAIGDNAVRKRVASFTKHQFTIARHTSAIVASTSNIEEGSMLLHGCIVQPFSHIGKHVIINTGAQVDHDCKIEDFVHIAPGAVLCGTVSVGEGALLGARSVILPGKKVGCWAIVGAGAVVHQDVPDYAVVAGNPAKILRYTKSI